MSEERGSREIFIIRRAFWTGRAQRGDVVRAFDVSPNLASMAIGEAATSWRSHVRRVGRMGISPLPGVPTPDIASASTMLQLFERHASQRETGIFPEELTVFCGTSPIYRGDENTTESLLRACLNHTPVEILYVGLRKAETARWRLIVPVALDFTGAQWRLSAADADKECSQVKTFALARILGVRAATRSAKDTGIATGAHGELTTYKVTLSSELTPDQVRAVRQEYEINSGGRMRLRKNIEFEFKRDFCLKRPPLQHITWPVFIDIAEEG